MNELETALKCGIPAFPNARPDAIRTVVIDGELWFVGKDVCEAFGDTNYRRSLRSLDADEKGVSQIPTPGGRQSMTVVNESGLYSLLFAMQPQKAKGVSQNEEKVNMRIEQLKAFRHWVTHDVLPSIRRHGMYVSDSTLERWMLDGYDLLREIEKQKRR